MSTKKAGPAHRAAAWRVVGTDAEAIEHLHQVRDLVRYATSRLSQADVAFGHGTGNAIDEAIWLVCWVLHLPIERYAELADAAVVPSEVRAAVELIRQRCSTRKPLAYLIGEAWLRGQRFLSDERALVPRSLIAEVLETEGFDLLLERAAFPQRILDLCCGGASIGILAAMHFPEARLVGADLSRPALALAAENLALHQLQARMELVHGDLFDGVRGQRFDLILCNPPYVNQQSLQKLPAEYRAEPEHALAGGRDGMDLVARILRDARRHMNEGALLLIEIGHEAEHFVARFPTLEFHWMEATQGPDMVVAIEAAALDALEASSAL